MIRVESNASQVLLRMKKRRITTRNLVGSFCEQKRTKYYIHALMILNRVVYAHPTTYNRTYALRNSLTVEHIREIDTEGLYIYLDPDKVANGLRSQSALGKAAGNFEYYPSYVKRGIFFRRRMSQRPFRLRWREEIGDRFVRDFKRHFQRRVLQAK